MFMHLSQGDTELQKQGISNMEEAWCYTDSG